MAKDRTNMGGPTQGRKDEPTEDRDNRLQPSGMSAQSQSSPIGDEERSNRDHDPYSDHGVTRPREMEPMDEEQISVERGGSGGSDEEAVPLDVLVNTDSSIEGNERLSATVTETVRSSLSRFADFLTRVEVHLTDENSGKGGNDDKKCTMEARPRGLQPIAASASAETVEEAVTAAAGKLKRAMDSAVGKLRDRRPPAPEIVEG